MSSVNLLTLLKNPRKLNTKQWRDWNQTIFSLLWKIWGITLIIELFIFIFFQPTPDCDHLRYFRLYILRPSGLELITLVSFQVLFTKVFKIYNKRIVSLYTILLVSIFACIVVWVHATVKVIPTMLILPMMLTPLYKDKLMTILQGLLVIGIYVLHAFYFISHIPVVLPETSFSPFVELSTFVGCIIATYSLLLKVNETIVLNEERSRHDSLTRLYNHENFYEELEYYMSRFDQSAAPFSIIIADIDNFKKVNDTYGHSFGDDVIKKVGELILEIGGQDAFCARYGGEEFAMILPHADPSATAEKIRASFEKYPFETTEGIRHFTLSIGTASYREKCASSSTFFEKADEALYTAKKTGKNRVVSG